MKIRTDKQYRKYLAWSKLTPRQYFFNRLKTGALLYGLLVIVYFLLVQENILDFVLGWIGGVFLGSIIIFPFKNIIHKRIADSVKDYEASLGADKINDEDINKEWNYKEISDFLNGVKTGRIISSSCGHTADKDGPLTSFSFPKYGCEIHVHWKDENREEIAVAHIKDIITGKRISNIVDTQTIAMLRYFSGLDNKKIT